MSQKAFVVSMGILVSVVALVGLSLFIGGIAGLIWFLMAVTILVVAFILFWAYDEG